jgi:hypothetical protein
MNILPRDKQIAVISALTEGCSIPATERLTGIHRDTIMRLGVRVGDGCGALHDEMMQFVQVNRVMILERSDTRAVSVGIGPICFTSGRRIKVMAPARSNDFGRGTRTFPHSG